MKRLPVRGDDKRRRLLVVKRAESLKVPSGLFELDDLADNIDDI